MSITPYMVELATKLKTERELSESSANTYLRCLATLNGKRPFRNLVFLKDVEAIEAIITPYASNTQTNLYVACVVGLSAFKDKAGYKKPYDHYYKKMVELRDGRKTEDAKNERSAKQKESMPEWTEVQKKHDELKAEVESFNDQKTLSVTQYSTLLKYVVLSLYTLVPPRRNMDYLKMYIIKDRSEGLDSSKNYYIQTEQKFIFHVFKTSKTAGEGEKVMDVPADLQAVLTSYIRHHPLLKAKKKDVKLLVEANGTPIEAVNAITRILNRIFLKKVGSSMLRHSYLSGKYGKVLEDMKEDSTAMAHGLNTQRDYIKTE